MRRIDIAASINQVFKDTPDADTRLLLETTAGQGSGVGLKFEELSRIIEKIHQKNRIGVCLHIQWRGEEAQANILSERIVRQQNADIGCVG